MKKLLLALLTIAGITTANAQSSVTVYGILDVGYIGTNYKGISGSASSSQTSNYFGSSAEAPSRLGFRGVEDLGGGTSAFFTLETGITPTNATVSTWNNRQSFVGLKQNGIGQFAVGTQYTPIFNAVLKTDAGDANDMLGNLIFAANPQVVGNPGSAPYGNYSTGAGTSDSFTVRTSNTMTVKSDNFAGFVGSAFVAANNQNSTQTNSTTGGTNNASGWGLGVNYEWKKLLLTANYQALKSLQTAATLTSPTPSIWSAAGGGVNTQDNQTYLAATYDFGILKAYAQYINRKATDTLNTGYYASRRAEQIGVRGFFTPRIEGWASAGLGKVQAFGQGQPTANFTGYQLGANYWLSKRTNLYTIFGSTQTSSTGGTSGYPISANGYALGVKHTF
jgi:predicted porin